MQKHDLSTASLQLSAKRPNLARRTGGWPNSVPMPSWNELKQDAEDTAKRVAASKEQRQDIAMVASYWKAVGGTPLSLSIPILILVAERQHIMDLVIGQTTRITLNHVEKDDDGTYIVTCTLEPMYSISLFYLEFRNHRLLHSVVVVKPVLSNSCCANG